MVLLLVLGRSVGPGLGWSVDITRPWWHLRERLAAGTSSLWDSWGTKEDLIAENKALRRESDLLRAELTQLHSLELENRHLRVSLGLGAVETPVTVAAVLSGPGRTPLNTLIISAEAGDQTINNLASGNFIGLEGGLIIGQIIEVDGGLAKVKLFSAPGVEVAAVLGEAATPIKLQGRGLGNFTAEVPHGASVGVGDLAAWPGRGFRWLLAEVGAVEYDEGETIQKVFLRVPFNQDQ